MATAVAGAPNSAAAPQPDMYARDAVIAWFRGEFAAANAIIDALCNHLAQIGGAMEHEAAFTAIRRRRMNWFPVIHLQKFYSTAAVSAELRRVAALRSAAAAEAVTFLPAEALEIKKHAEVLVEKATAPEAAAAVTEEEKVAEESKASPMDEEEEEADGAVNGEVISAVEEADGEDSSGDSSDRRAAEEDAVADGGSQEEQSATENVQICSNHDNCTARPESIKILKGFVAKESVKGHMVNVVKGLKIYHDIFTDSELTRLSEFINDLRQAGRRGELSGETFIFFNKQMKGNKREIIQLGVPLFQPTTEEATSKIEPIPPVLQAVIDHLVQWRLIPEGRKPNSCIVNFFDEDEYSQPYFKPPHLDNPISTLLLSETSMAFGRMLVSNQNGNYKGPLTLDLKEGSLLVMRGNSADMARHVVCPSSNRRVSITFVKVRPSLNQTDPPTAITSPTKAMALWQPGTLLPQKAPGSGTTVISYVPHAMIPAAWGMALRAPLVMVAPTRPVALNATRRITRGGTGVFLPWAVGPKRYNKHLPPRIQKRRFSTLMSTVEAQG